MAVSEPVKAYYRKHIFEESGRDRVPRNFRPLDVPPTGKSTVEGCAGGGKNILELSIAADSTRVVDLRASCGLCNPAMYAAVDVVCEWARGRPLAEVTALDPFHLPSLDPLFERLGGGERPEDAREKFQYALVALQNAIRAHRGLPPVAAPRIASTPDGGGRAGG